MEEKKQPRIKILVACHKADPNIRQDDIYMPIQVGKALHPDLDLGFQCDNTGDNISDKNGSYCELTALYWAWKNLKDVDYIGLCHYRRYFDFSKQILNVTMIPQYKYSNNEKYKLTQLLKYNDILTPRHNIYPYSVAVDYCVGHHSDDLRIVRDVINEKMPQYCHAFKKAIMLSNSSSPYNMFVTRWDIFDEYCSFLFPLLAEVENRTNTRDYNPYQKRLLGFLAERIWNIFLAYKRDQNINSKRLPVLWITDEHMQSIWKYLANIIRYKISFNISFSRHVTL